MLFEQILFSTPIRLNLPELVVLTANTNVLVNQAITREWPKGSQFDKTIFVLIFEVAHLIKKEKNL